jgi:hypothetical protein
MEGQRSVFISSCSRRDLSRRRPQHYSALRLQLTLALAVAAAIVLVLALRGSL